MVAEKKPPLEIGYKPNNAAQLPFVKKSQGELFEVLHHPDAWWQTTAQRLLLEVELEFLNAGSIVNRRLKKSPSGTALAAYQLHNHGELEINYLNTIWELTRDPLVKRHVLRLGESNINSFWIKGFLIFVVTPR